MGEKQYGLLGRHLRHSWSVPIHAALGCTDYRLIELEPEELGAFLARTDIGGLNVTLPYKRDVMPYCDVLEPLAAEIGSVNTIVRRADGRLYGCNTDAAGFCFMARRAGIGLAGRKVLVLGSGGASLTVRACAGKLGARETVVISRSGPDSYENLDRHADAEIVVNTTPLGMYPRCGEAAVDLRAFPQCRGVLDLIYNPRRTALLLQAEALGIPCSDGLPMLVEQARAAEELFFGRPIAARESERLLAQLRREQTNLVLIGMPGSGKSTIGAALAALTGREAIDFDERIVQKTGRSIPDIFAADGEAAFRALEREVAAECGAESGKILITGGGVVKTPENYAALHQNGRIYQLLRPLELLSTDGRPLSQGRDLAALWTERAPLYERFCDAAADNSGTVEQTAQNIWRDFCENFSDQRP